MYELLCIAAYKSAFDSLRPRLMYMRLHTICACAESIIGSMLMWSLALPLQAQLKALNSCKAMCAVHIKLDSVGF